MATEKPKNPQARGADVEAGGKQGDGGAAGPGARWDLRRAELEFWRPYNDAALDYQQRSAAAISEYHQALKQIADDASGEELAALEAAASQSQEAELPIERAAEIAHELRTKVMAIRQEAGRRTRVEGRSLAEAQHTAWLDALEKQNDAYANYQQAVERAYQPGGGGIGALGAAGFAAAGDEGGGFSNLPGFPDLPVVLPAWTQLAGFTWGRY